MVDIELHDEVARWMTGLDEHDWNRAVVALDRLAESLSEGLIELRFTLGQTARRITYRFTKDGRIVLLTTFRKQRQNERAEITRARAAAADCARRYP